MGDRDPNTEDAVRAIRSLAAMMHASGYEDHSQRLGRRVHVLAADTEFAKQHDGPPTSAGVIHGGSPRREVATAAASSLNGPYRSDRGRSPGADSMAHLAEMYAARGEYHEAERLLHRVIELVTANAKKRQVAVVSLGREGGGGPIEAPEALPYMLQLADVLDAAGDTHEAVCIRRRIVQLREVAAA